MTIPTELATHIANLQAILQHQEGGLDPYRPALGALLEQLLIWQEQSVTSPGELGPQGVDPGAIAQAVVQQINLQQSEWLYPLQNELTLLKQQRERLLIEIRQLENQRQQTLESFLQVVVQQSTEAIKERLSTVTMDYGSGGIDLGEFYNHNYAQVQKLKHLQTEADELFLQLDQTLNQGFNVLQQDFVTHTASLGENLTYLQSVVGQAPLPPEGEANLPAPALPLTAENLSFSDRPGAQVFPGEESVIPEEPTPLEMELFETGDFPKEPEAMEGLMVNVPVVLPPPGEITAPSMEVTSTLDEFTFPDLQAINANLEDILFGEIKLQAERMDGGDSPNNNSLELSPPPSETTVNTIKLLSDLLEEGALDAMPREGETLSATEDHRQTVATEDLLPEQEQRLSVVPPMLQEHLTPNQMEALEDNLNNFERGGGAVSPNPMDSPIDMEEAG